MTLAAQEQNTESFQTFDDWSADEIKEDIVDEAEESSEDWGKEEKPAKQKDEGLKVLKDSEVDGEGKLIKDDKEVKKKEKEEKKTFDDEEEGEEEEVEAKEDEELDPKAEEKKESKKIRMRMGDELYNIESEATVKHKVDGEMVDVSIQELLNNYSGKVAYDKKFTEIGKEKKTIESEKALVTREKEVLNNHLRQALDPIKDKTKNPMDSLLYLVEMSGEDPYAAWRRIIESNLEELGQLIDMPEVERELYYHKKKDELHGNVAKKRQEKVTKEQAFNQAIQKVDSLRQTYNVTEDDFVDASEELESIYKDAKLDANSITDEAIVDYASLKPHIAKVKELIAPYEENISEGKYGDVVAQLSRYLRDGKADEAAVKTILKRNFSVEEDVKELNTKVYQKGEKTKKVALKEEVSGSSETFDDF